MATQFDVEAFRKGICTSEPTHSTVCIVRSVTKTHIEAQFDPGVVGAWVFLPLDEIKTATVVRQVNLPTGEYSLVKLELNDEHPQIEIAALSAQLDQMLNRHHEGCSCSSKANDLRFQTNAARAASQTTRLQNQPADPGDPGVGDCYRLCKGLKGCQYWGCWFGCVAAG